MCERASDVTLDVVMVSGSPQTLARRDEGKMNGRQIARRHLGTARRSTKDSLS
jgi:hypothetical protein